MNIDWKEHCGCYEAVVGGTHIAIGWRSFELSEWDAAEGVIGASWYTSYTTNRSYVEHVIYTHVLALVSMLDGSGTTDQRHLLRMARWIDVEGHLTVAGLVQVQSLEAYRKAGVSELHGQAP